MQPPFATYANAPKIILSDYRLPYVTVWLLW